MIARRFSRPAVALLVVLTLAACGDGDDDTQSSAETPTPTAITSAPSSAPTSAPASTSTTTEPESPGNPILEFGVATVAGETYSMGETTGPALEITITDDVGERYGYSVPGMAGIGDANDLSAQLVDVFELGTAEVFVEARVDFSQLSGGVPPEMVELAPSDFLTWMSTRPGVTASEITETTFAGVPARTMTYNVGEVEGSLPCYPGDDRGCLASVTNTALGFGYVDFENTSMTLYQFEVAGVKIVVAVSALPGAAELAQTITITATT